MAAGNAADIFNFLDDLWELLPEQDRNRFAETWKSYEQVYGDVWTKIIEQKMAGNIDYLPLYNVQRWIQYSFGDDYKINRPARYRSNQDLSQGINLSTRFLIKMSIDNLPPVEIDLRGADPFNTRLTEIVLRINNTVGQTVAFAVEGNQLLEFVSPTIGPTSSIEFYPTGSPAQDASEIILGLDPIDDLPKKVPFFPYEYTLPDKFIVGIPSLQDKVREENVTTELLEGDDFAVEFGTGIISFKDLPPESMWARDTLVNKETPYNNYGFLLDVYDSNTASYLKAVKGLWYAFWTGPRPENIRRSLYLLFGLPTASQAGIVSKVNETSITLLYDDGTSEVFTVPSELKPTVVLNQRVTRFEPLVTGIQVFDKINYPGFLTREVGRFGVQPFLTENATRGSDPNTDESRALRMLEENTYLPQIDVNSFISPDIRLGNVRTFLTNLQPRSRSFLFQVLVGVFREPLTVLDEGPTSQTSPDFPNGIPSLGLHISFDVTPNVDYNPNTECSQEDLDAIEANDTNETLSLDEGFLMGDKVEVEVYHGVTLVDTFTIEG